MKMDKIQLPETNCINLLAFIIRSLSFRLFSVSVFRGSFIRFKVCRAMVPTSDHNQINGNLSQIIIEIKVSSELTIWFCLYVREREREVWHTGCCCYLLFGYTIRIHSKWFKIAVHFRIR